MEEIGKRIKSIRESKGLSLREVGRRLDISHAYLSKLENGKHNPNLKQLNKMAELFGVDVTEFFGATKVELPDELKGYADWIAFADEMEKKDLTPDEIRQIINFMRKINK